jgi:hypothetical protein
MKLIELWVLIFEIVERYNMRPQSSSDALLVFYTLPKPFLDNYQTTI